MLLSLENFYGDEPFHHLDGVCGHYSSDGMIRYQFELDEIW
jgi:hypothetical protein